ncbi:hypothetical protein HNF00_003625 [Salmonella enterica]|nr:hypothetical protein [Salmonella enterica]EBX0545139.1 hypothetical protein [Salmonella enterica subsp. houtenae serovar 44:z4,z23:-]EDQ8007044.1 hypothetical protein [Salmonella enterica subsp. houtenae]EBH0303752.1 hypothetical protein [Salmonella enterica]EBI4063256.1 hypothetical protein [Salmonella enterica]
MVERLIKFFRRKGTEIFHYALKAVPAGLPAIPPTSATATVAQQRMQRFSDMDDHEKAMVVHQSMNNAHSFAHVIQAEGA